VLAAAPAQAADGAPLAGLSLKAAMTTYTGYEGFWLNDGFDNPVNPGNQVLQAPTSTWLVDVRPVVKVESDAGFSVVAKPWLLVTGNWVPVQVGPTLPGATSYSQNVGFEWIEAYARWQVTDDLTVTAGTQNVQWGPGELFSPSNEIFPFFFQNNTPLFYYRGRQLFQANYTPTRDTSLMLLAEYAPNNDPTFQYGVPFNKKALVKGETTFTTGDGGNAQTVGVVLGTDEQLSSWLGQYANFTLSDSVSLYLDASENNRKTAYYPNTLSAPGSIVMGYPETSNIGFFPNVLAGGRYTFPKGWELRIEYMYDGLGWTQDQYQSAIASLSDPDFGGYNLPRFIAPGLNFRGQHYAYASLRIGDLGHKDKLTYFLRYLQNLTDLSGSAIVSLEWTPADRWGVIAAAIVDRGNPNTELMQVETAQLQAALKLNF
jgi:hypothetical protein